MSNLTLILSIFISLYLCLSSIIPSLSSASSLCPIPVPSPKNPIGCKLYNFSVANEISFPYTVSYDYIAEPNTLIVTDSRLYTNTAPHIYYTNGTFFRSLSLSSTTFSFSGAAAATVDDKGYLYLATIEYILIFTSYPYYSFIDGIDKQAVPLVNIGIHSHNLNTYLALQYLYKTVLYHIFILDNTYVNATLVATTDTPETGWPIGGLFDPITQQLTVIDETNANMIYYDLNYITAYNVNISLNHTISLYNLTIANNDNYISDYEVDNQEHIIVLTTNIHNGSLGLLVLDKDGHSILTPAIGNTAINQFQFYPLLTIRPDGSVIYIPDPINAVIVAFQGPMIASLSSSSISAINTHVS